MATVEATTRFVRRKVLGSQPSTLGRSGLQISPVGFGCHRLENIEEHRNALEVAIKLGCNFIDVAPNYTDGAAECAVGIVLQELFQAGDIRRDELVIATKVGNVVGTTLRESRNGVLGSCEAARVRDDVWHCIDPMWIEKEISGSLDRLGVECIDVLRLHCPEFATNAEGVEIEDVYRRVGRAFEHLETEVARGRICRYGVSAAFYPLRPRDPEHLLLDRLMSLVPADHHFEVLQFPFNFAEPQPLWVSHTARDKDGIALDKEHGLAASPLLEQAKKYGLATLTNRPLDGIYLEMRGVLRFTSDPPMNGEMQGEDLDALEARLTTVCKPALGNVDGGEDSVTEQLAGKTIKVLSSLADVDCVLVGMRQVSYVSSVAYTFHQKPRLDDEVARQAVRRAHDSICMWFCASAHEDDHGTAKDWRLPVRDSFANRESLTAGQAGA